MTDRERWMIYPLLLLSLATSLRSHITGSLDLHEIRCKTLRCDHVMVARDVEVAGSGGKVVLVLSAGGEKAGGGTLALLSADGKPGVMLHAAPDGGSVEVATPGKGPTEGRREVILRATPAGGRIEVESPSGASQVALGGAPMGGFVQLYSTAGVPQVVLEVAPPGGLLATIDAQGKAVRTLGIGIDQTRRLRQPDAAGQGKPAAGGADAGEKPTGEGAEMPDKPAADKPQAEKPATDEPSAGTPGDKPEPDKASTDDKKPTDDKPTPDKPGDN